MQDLVQKWFDIWQSGNFHDLPISDDFIHQSPFGTISSKQAYLTLVEANKDKFLGYQFIVYDMISAGSTVCVRYTAIQGDFRLDVSEWHYIKAGLIEKVIAYYHIGEIRPDRELS